MKYLLGIIYIVGFIIFYQIMTFLKVDEYLLFFLNESNKNEKSQIQTTQKKEGDILTPPDGTKPLKLTKQEIGRNAWALLHSVAATYPIEPKEEDKKYMKDFIFGLAKTFPCKICSKHFVKILQQDPIKLDTREDLVYYLCDVHNIVNKFLKKELFDCKKAFDIWGGDCGCDANR